MLFLGIENRFIKISKIFLDENKLKFRFWKIINSYSHFSIIKEGYKNIP